MASKQKFLVIAAVLLVAGVLSFLLQPGAPDPECVTDGGPSSGFVDGDCQISIESYEEIRDYETGPKPFRILGLVLVVAGLGVGAYGLTRKGDAAPPPDDAAA